MKKWCSLLLMAFLVVCFALPASAEKTDWEDKSYDFSRAQRVVVYDVALKDTAEFENDLIGQVLQEEYEKCAARPKYDMVRQRGLTGPPAGTALENADLYVTAELLKWHDDSYIKPEYTTYEKKEFTRVKKHSDGSKSTEKYYVTVPVVHPPEKIYTSTVRMRFDVYDARTGNRVMARDETRLRDESHHGQRGIFGRISKSFFEDLGKKMHRK
ncbi:MAG: hypothetical protein IKH16_10460 [Selenomonadaceae bacterium]|nr:hypothetical protein [Selenomonadaceae bacterium]